MALDDDDLQAQLEEALRRSRAETTIEESNLAEALANSLTTHDEELALAMQREQLRLLEADLCKNLSVDSSAAGSAWQQQPPNARRFPGNPQNQSSQPQQLSRVLQPPANASGKRPRSAPQPQQKPIAQPRGRGQSVPSGQQLRDRRPVAQNGYNNGVARRFSPPHAPNAWSGANGPHNSQHPAAPRSSPPHNRGSPRRSPSISENPGPWFSVSPSTAQTTKHHSHPNSSIPPVQLSDPYLQTVRQAPTSPPRSSPTYATTAASVPQYKPPSLQGRPSHGSPSSPTAHPVHPPIPAGDPAVVIDGQNVGCEYGGNVFRSRGVEITLDYYATNGVPAIALLPRNKVDNRRFLGRGATNTLVADDPGLLMKLSNQGRVFFTPAGAHDDYFLLTYAMRKEADIISNDRFMKELDLQETAQDVRTLRSFLDSHLIPYTFVADDFVPNPKPSQLGRALHQSRAVRR